MTRQFTKTDKHEAAITARGPRGPYGPRGKNSWTDADKNRLSNYQNKMQATITVAETYGIPLDRAGHLGDRVRRTMMSRILRGYRLAIGCQVCGYNKNARALHFHHRDRSTKKFNIGSQVVRCSNKWVNIIDEIEKCDVLCANCHCELEDQIDSSNTRDLTGKVILPT
jgi:hypothetical protein